MPHQCDTITRAVEQMEVIPDEWRVWRLNQYTNHFAGRHELRCLFHGIRDGDAGIHFDVSKLMDLDDGFAIKWTVVVPKEFCTIG